MPENDEAQWKYVAKFSFGKPSVVKVRLHETPQNWRVMESIPVYGSPYGFEEGKLLLKRKHQRDMFDWFIDALKALNLRMTGSITRLERNLADAKAEREKIITLIREILAEEAKSDE